ncbi:MAG TPA: hypothetical protein QGF58_14150 [Myxococcota bacterium]|nr:hypothetical protein [Myxococcota bacterium]
MTLDLLNIIVMTIGLGLGAWRRLPLVGVAAAAGVAICLTPLSGASIFGLMRTAAWALFVFLPLGLVVRGWFGPRWVGLGALPLCAVAIDAFFVEPTALEVSHVEIHTSKVSDPLRIALVADIQTDEVGPYEREVLEAVAAQEPDLVLYAGDYIQAPTEDTAEEHLRLNNALRIGGLGDYPGVAVEGDIDRSGWESVFDGTSVSTSTGRHELAGLVVTAWDSDDSRSDSLHHPKETAFHVALGHSPDFVLSKGLDADLVVAGHVHGGQVQLPLFGPLMTLSRLPRDQTHGHTVLGDTHLVVSRGVGLERRDAPRLRFLCRPEVVIIHLVPDTGATPS